VTSGAIEVDEWERKRLEATVQAAALCAYVDGHLADEEREKMCECIAVHAANEEEARHLLALVWELPEWTQSPKAGYRASQFEEIKAGLSTKAERQHAFHLAVEVANAHRGIDVHETSFLLNLIHELGIDGDYAREVLDRARTKKPIAPHRQ
jgi:tellurite resistance protein